MLLILMLLKHFLTYDLNTFSIKGNPVFSNGLKIPPKNPPSCPIYSIEFLVILY